MEILSFAPRGILSFYLWRNVPGCISKENQLQRNRQGPVEWFDTLLIAAKIPRWKEHKMDEGSKTKECPKVMEDISCPMYIRISLDKHHACNLHNVIVLSDDILQWWFIIYNITFTGSCCTQYLKHKLWWCWCLFIHITYNSLNNI